MNIDQLAGETGTDIGAIGARFGMTPEQTRHAMASLLPAVAGGFEKQGDLNGVQAAAQLGHGAVPHEAVAPGNAVLGSIFGSKDVSRQVAQHASGQTGMSGQIMKALLPIVAAMVAQHLMGRMGGGAGGGMGGGLGGMLGSVLGGGAGSMPGGGMGGGLGGAMGGAPAQQQGGGGGGLGDLLGGLLGGGGRPSGGGNPLDAILGGMMGGRR